MCTVLCLFYDTYTLPPIQKQIYLTGRYRAIGHFYCGLTEKYRKKNEHKGNKKWVTE